jgi:hypothetical protein
LLFGKTYALSSILTISYWRKNHERKDGAVNNIYLIPNDNDGYHADVAWNLPTYNAILLTKELGYPVPFWTRMYNKHMESRLHFESANSRDELICKLNVLGKRGATIVRLWDYYEPATPDRDLSELFARCVESKLDAYWKSTQNI